MAMLNNQMVKLEDHGDINGDFSWIEGKCDIMEGHEKSITT